MGLQHAFPLETTHCQHRVNSVVFFTPKRQTPKRAGTSPGNGELAVVTENCELILIRTPENVDNNTTDTVDMDTVAPTFSGLHTVPGIKGAKDDLERGNKRFLNDVNTATAHLSSATVGNERLMYSNQVRR